MELVDLTNVSDSAQPPKPPEPQSVPFPSQTKPSSSLLQAAIMNKPPEPQSIPIPSHTKRPSSLLQAAIMNTAARHSGEIDLNNVKDSARPPRPPGISTPKRRGSPGIPMPRRRGSPGSLPPRRRTSSLLQTALRRGSPGNLPPRRRTSSLLQTALMLRGKVEKQFTDLQRVNRLNTPTRGRLSRALSIRALSTTIPPILTTEPLPHSLSIRALSATEPYHPVPSPDPTPASTPASTPTAIQQPEIPEIPKEVTKRETWGWYCYDIASKVYSVVIRTFMGPVLVSSLAKLKIFGRQAGCKATPDTADANFTNATEFAIYNYKYTNDFDDLIYPPSCEVFNRVQKMVPEGYAPNVCLLCFAGRGSVVYDCTQNGTSRWSVPEGAVDFGPFRAQAFTFTTFVISLSVFFQAIMIIVTGPCADYGKNRKLFLILSALLGIFSSMGLFFVYDADHYDVGGVLLILSNVGFGMSLVFYNAYLPLLTDAHPEVIKAMHATQGPLLMGDAHHAHQISVDAKAEVAAAEFKNTVNSKRSCCSRRQHPDPAEDGLSLEQRVNVKRSKVERKMSDFASAAGHGAGLLVLMLCIPIVFLMDNNQPDFLAWIGFRLCVLLGSIWWLVFSIPTFVLVRARPGPELPASRCCGKSPARYLIFGVESLAQAFWQARKYRHALLFLFCYFIYSDCYSTIATVGILFAKDELCFDDLQLAFLPIIIGVSAILGIYFYQRLQHCSLTKLTAKHVIITNLCFFLLIAAYGLIGFIDALPFGLTIREELYIFCFIYGFQVGALKSNTRTAFISMIPEGKEAQFFSLYEIADKGSSFIGPAVVGIMYHQTGKIRFGFAYLMLLFIPIAVLIFCVDFKKGAEAAGEDFSNVVTPAKDTKDTKESPNCDADDDTDIVQYGTWTK